MRPIILIVLAVCCPGFALGAEHRIVHVQFYDGIYLDLPEDWVVIESGKIVATVATTSGKTPPAGANFERLFYPPPVAGPAVLNLSIRQLAPNDASAARRDFEPAQYERTAARSAQQLQESATAKGGRLKFPTPVERKTISGLVALTTHTEVATPHDTDSVFDGVYLCAGNALIALTALKYGHAPDAWADLDRVRTSLRLVSLGSQVKQPWESNSTSSSPSSAAKPADGTIWKSFSGLAKEAGPNETATEEWQNSWDVFAREVQALYARSATPAESAQRFNGRRVAWEGVVDMMDTIFHLEEAGVPIQMPKKIIRLPDGQTCPLDRLQLSFGDAKVPVDETFRFRATLDRGSAPAVFVGTWPGQKTRAIVVKVSAGELIK